MSSNYAQANIQSQGDQHHDGGRGADTGDSRNRPQHPAASSGTTEVSNNISGVQKAANDTGAAATQTLQAASLLAEMAGKLEQEVTGFIDGRK